MSAMSKHIHIHVPTGSVSVTDSGDWEESKHPRAENGQFGAGGGGSSSGPRTLPKGTGHARPEDRRAYLTHKIDEAELRRRAGPEPKSSAPAKSVEERRAAIKAGTMKVSVPQKGAAPDDGKPTPGGHNHGARVIAEVERRAKAGEQVSVGIEKDKGVIRDRDGKEIFSLPLYSWGDKDKLKKYIDEDGFKH
jgi:hypothetical protein